MWIDGQDGLEGGAALASVPLTILGAMPLVARSLKPIV